MLRSNILGSSHDTAWHRRGYDLISWWVEKFRRLEPKSQTPARLLFLSSSSSSFSSSNTPSLTYLRLVITGILIDCCSKKEKDSPADIQTTFARKYNLGGEQQTRNWTLQCVLSSALLCRDSTRGGGGAGPRGRVFGENWQFLGKLIVNMKVASFRKSDRWLFFFCF